LSHPAALKEVIFDNSVYFTLEVPLVRILVV
jgi:hypothetical protein